MSEPLSSNERLAAALPTAEELAMLRGAYAETYPVRPLLNEIDRLRAENERLTRERDEWAAKWHKVRAELAELKYPGMKGVVRPADETSAVCQHNRFKPNPTLSWMGSTPDVMANAHRFRCTVCQHSFDLAIGEAQLAAFKTDRGP